MTNEAIIERIKNDPDLQKLVKSWVAKSAREKANPKNMARSFEQCSKASRKRWDRERRKKGEPRRPESFKA